MLRYVPAEKFVTSLTPKFSGSVLSRINWPGNRPAGHYRSQAAVWRIERVPESTEPDDSADPIEERLSRSDLALVFGRPLTLDAIFSERLGKDFIVLERT